MPALWGVTLPECWRHLPQTFFDLFLKTTTPSRGTPDTILKKLLHRAFVHFGNRVENVRVEIFLRSFFRALNQFRHGDRVIIRPRNQRTRQQQCENAAKLFHGQIPRFLSSRPASRPAPPLTTTSTFPGCLSSPALFRPTHECGAHPPSGDRGLPTGRCRRMIQSKCPPK